MKTGKLIYTHCYVITSYKLGNHCLIRPIDLGQGEEMAAFEAIQQINQLVEADAKGDRSAHHKLLKAIGKLQLVVETPQETTSRVNFQVST